MLTSELLRSALREVTFACFCWDVFYFYVSYVTKNIGPGEITEALRACQWDPL